MLILLDTNILLRSANPADSQYQVTADAIDALHDRGHKLVLVPQVLYEFWVVATRPIENNGLGWTSAKACGELLQLQDVFRLLRDERTIFACWQRLVSQYDVKGKQAHDARIVAAMERFGLTRLLTFNIRDFTRYPSIRAISPESVRSGV